MKVLIKSLDSFIEESMCKLQVDDSLESLRDTMIKAQELKNELERRDT
jgi:hypothetical protein